MGNNQEGGRRMKRALSPAALSPLSPCATLASRPLFFPRSKRPREQRPRFGCVARGWESQSRAVSSNPSGAVLKHANDVNAIEDMIRAVAGRCRVDDTWHSWEPIRDAHEAVQHNQPSIQSISPQLPLCTAAACAEPAEAISSGSREHGLQLQRGTSDAFRSGSDLKPLPLQRSPTLTRPESNLDMLLGTLLR